MDEEPLVGYLCSADKYKHMSY